MAASTNAKTHQTTPTGRDAHGDAPLEIAKNYFVEKRGDQWCVVDSTRTKTLGCHPSKAEADAQLRAIEASKAARGASQKNFACSIEGWPIFRTGTWNGDAYAVSDLQQMADAFSKVGFQPPFKLGHVDDPGAPAIGWVSNLRVEQDALVVDITDVDPKVCEGIVQHNFGPPSAEIFWDFERNGASYPRVLGGVALLGGEVPAVAGLSHARDHLTQNATWESVKTYELPDGPINIKVVPMKESPPMPEPTEVKAQVTMAETEKTETPAADAPVKIVQQGGKFCLADATGDMMDPPECYPTRMAAEAALKTHAEKTPLKTMAVNDEVKTPEFDAMLLALQKDLGLSTEHIAEFRTRMLGKAFVIREEYDALKNRLVEMDQAETTRRESMRLTMVEQFAASIISPRFRSYLRPLFDTLTGGPKVAKFAREKTADDKDLIEDVEAVDILRELADYANGLTSKMFGTLSTEEVKRNERPAEMNPREELAQRIKDYAKAHNLHPITDAKTIQDEVFKADPQLKEAYARS